MKNRLFCLMITAALLLPAASLWSAVIHVSTTGNNANDGLSWNQAKLTVQAGLNAAASGDEVWVAAGIYVERVTLKSGVALYGGFIGSETERDQRDWSANTTVLDGDESGSVVTSPSGATTDTRVDGFTIQNGTAYSGGGIYCYRSSPTVANNTVRHNTASVNGGGFYLSESHPVIVDNVITDNANSGIYCTSSSPTISGNIISGSSTGIYCSFSAASITANTIAGNSGYGIYCHIQGTPSVNWNTISSNGCGVYSYYTSPAVSNNTITRNNGNGVSCFHGSPIITDNIIAGNDAVTGGGISCVEGSPTVTNNTIYGNSVIDDGGGILVTGASSPQISNNIIASNLGAGIDCSACTGSPTLRNNCVYDNNYLGISPGTGDISEDPLLVNPDDRDFHIASNSPCVDAGWNSAPMLAEKDMDNNPRIWNGVVDIGAYEYALPGQVYMPLFSPDGGSFTEAQQIAVTCATPDAVIRYTTNGADPTEADPIIESGQSVLVDGSMILKAKAWKDGLVPSGVKTAQYLIVVQTPTFSPDGGKFENAVPVTVNCGTPGATIRYTLDGRDPVETDPIVASGGSVTVGVDPSTTLKARAWKEGLDPSEVKSAVYSKADYITIGSGTTVWDYPLHTYYHDCRTQIIYLAGEIGGASTITALALNIATIPGQDMSNFTIRMKHTTLSAYSQAYWEADGWTTVYQSNEPRGETGWRQFDFSTPFEYNGVDNLMVDISINNASYSSSGYCRYSIPGGNRSVYFRTDSGYGDPLTWSGTTPNPGMTTYVPNIRLWIDTGPEPQVVSVQEAKTTADGTFVQVSEAVVSAAWDNVFYVSADDRSSGIRVEKAAHGLTAGMRATVVGSMQTNSDDERYIEASSAVQAGSGTVEPMFLLGKNLGGSSLLDPDTGIGQVGVMNGSGLNNIGLLVSVIGKVTHVDTDFFYVDDGSTLNDGSGRVGLRVDAMGLSLPALDEHVIVTGISSCLKSGVVVRRLLMCGQGGG